MARIGIRRRSKEQQVVAAQLEDIISHMGDAMRYANRTFIGMSPACHHSSGINFTANMQEAWGRYVAFCMENPDD